MLSALAEDLEPDPPEVQKSSDFQLKFIMTDYLRLVQSTSINAFSLVIKWTLKCLIFPYYSWEYPLAQLGLFSLTLLERQLLVLPLFFLAVDPSQ